MGLFKRKARVTRGRSVVKNVRPVDMDAILAENDGCSRSWEGYYITENGVVLSIREWEGEDWWDDDEDEDDPKFAGGVAYDLVNCGSDGGIMDYDQKAVMRDFNDFQRYQTGGDIVGIIEFPDRDVYREFDEAFYDAQSGKEGAYERMQAIAAKHALYDRRLIG